MVERFAGHAGALNVDIAAGLDTIAGPVGAATGAIAPMVMPEAARTKAAKQSIRHPLRVFDGRIGPSGGADMIGRLDDVASKRLFPNAAVYEPIPSAKTHPQFAPALSEGVPSRNHLADRLPSARESDVLNRPRRCGVAS
jgi:hypothetical protein